MMQNKMLARAQVSEKLSWPKALAFISSRFVLIKPTNRQRASRKRLYENWTCDGVEV